MDKATAKWVIDWVKNHPNQDIPYPIAFRIKAAYAAMGVNAPAFLQFAYEGREALCGQISLDAIIMAATRWCAAFKGNLQRAQEWARVCFDPEAAIELHRSGVTPDEAEMVVHHNATSTTVGYLVSNGDWDADDAIAFIANSRDKNRAANQSEKNSQLVYSGCLGFRLL